MSLLTTGCLFGGDDEKAQPKDQPGQVAGPGGEPPADQPGPAPSASDPGTTPPQASGPAPAPGSAEPQPGTAPTTAKSSSPPAAGAEANVIKGVVRDEQGDPVPGARIRIAGYTGKPNGLSAADFIREVRTDAKGAYRLAVPAGLYGVSGEADLAFDGKTYKALYLHPADGNCQQQMSGGGIVKDFTLRLTGFMQCLAGADPKNAGFYSGAAIALMHESPKSLPGDAKLTLTLTPSGPLADGSTGKVLTFTRTVASVANFFGPLETTNTLHDIPLGRYRLTGSATLADGSRQAIRFGPWEKLGEPVSPVADYVVSFPAKVSLPYGLGQGEVSIYDAGWSGSEPVPTPVTPVAPQPQPSTTTTTAKPTTTCTTFSEYVGSIPVPC
ncbi:MAG: carboxypeptidase regulatory-like domain-containing protein [Actinomycetota bacterium]